MFIERLETKVERFDMAQIGQKWISKAQTILTSPRKIGNLLSAASFLIKQDVGFFQKRKEDLQTSLRLIRAYGSGTYKQVAWKSVLSLTAGIVYLVSPIDLVPDFIPVQGFLDDFTLLMIVFKQVEKDLLAFREWESRIK